MTRVLLLVVVVMMRGCVVGMITIRGWRRRWGVGHPPSSTTLNRWRRSWTTWHVHGSITWTTWWWRRSGVPRRFLTTRGVWFGRITAVICRWRRSYRFVIGSIPTTTMRGVSLSITTRRRIRMTGWGRWRGVWSPLQWLRRRYNIVPGSNRSWRRWWTLLWFPIAATVVSIDG